ncbi:MAG: DUF1566 domain-containing protein [Spirochaetota bacterium]
MLKPILHFILLLLLLVNCNKNQGNQFNNLLRLFGYSNDSSSALSLSISGTLSQNGISVSNTLISTSASSLSTSTSKKDQSLSRSSSSTDAIRCIDYNLASGYIKCLLIVNTANITGASSGCYQIYLASATNDQLESIAKFPTIASNQEIQFLYQKKIPSTATSFTVFSCNTGSQVKLASSSLTDYSSSDAILTDANGSYSLSVESGKYHTMKIRRATKDLGDITIDLTSVTTQAGLEEIKNDSTKLPLTSPSGFSHTITVNGPVTSSTANNGSSSSATDSSTGTTSIDIATLAEEANKDASLTPATSSNYSIGGTISGLSGTLTLQNNSSDSLSISSDGNFAFTSATAGYSVTVSSQPTGQVCTVNNGNGTASSNTVTNISISCVNGYSIGGTVSGLLTSGLVLQNNSGDDLSITADGNFTFSTALTSAVSYSVSISSQPTDMTCSVTSGSGSVAAANVNNIAIECSICYTWGCFTDQKNGTIKFVGVAGTFGQNTYSVQTLYFDKCTYGQVWNSASNNCQGTGSSGNFYGTDVNIKYCSTQDNSCNGGVAGNTLSSGTTGTAYDACAGLSLAGKSWRVPTRAELKLLIECTDKTMPDNNTNCGSSNYTDPATNSYLFPDTVSSQNYWTADSHSSVATNAHRINFQSGYNLTNAKDDANVVRCISGP